MGVKDCYGYCRTCPQSIFNNLLRAAEQPAERPQGMCWMGNVHDVILKCHKYENVQRAILGEPKYLPRKLR